MTIDLLKLAKLAEKTYKEVECSFGTVRIYHVPAPTIWTFKPDRPAPVEPVFKMKTATGSQNRAIKEGDEGYTEWQRESQRYEDELDDIRAAAHYVLALADIEYPDISQPPPLAVKQLNSHYPNSEILRKKVWLDYTVFAHTDDWSKIMLAMAELRGDASANNVGEIKKNSVSDSEDDQSASSEAETTTEA